MAEECNDINVPTVNEDSIECCDLYSTNCIKLAEAVPCLASGKGETLTTLLSRLCDVILNQNTIVTGSDGIGIDSTTVDGITTYNVSPPISVYLEVVPESDSDISVSAPSPGPTDYFFPVGYETLTYTNSSTDTKSYKVHASFDTPKTSALEINVVDAGIVKTVSGVDTIEYEMGIFSNEEPANASFFKVVTLAPSETVSLKFKTTGSDQSIIRNAQLLIEETKI